VPYSCCPSRSFTPPVPSPCACGQRNWRRWTRSDGFTPLGTNFAANAVLVNDKFIPEIDVDYAFADSFSAELVLTIPQTQDGRVGLAAQLRRDDKIDER
jgi:outer membrane protein W